MTEQHAPTGPEARQLILGVAASDAHAVANQLIAMMLRERGFVVFNLGVCTPLEDFADAYAANPSVEAILISSLNGHAYEDLQGLAALKSSGRIGCPVIVGGNLSVGSRKAADDVTRLYDIGVDHVLAEADALPELLDRLAADRDSRRLALV